MKQKVERISQKNRNVIYPQHVETIETCTMDPCPMKLGKKSDLPVKCPDCGKTDPKKPLWK